MHVRVRTMDGTKCISVEGLSKLTKLEDLRQRIYKLFDVTPERQKLFYRGKQLENDHTLFDYDVGMNHIIQLMVVQELPPGAGDGDPTGSDREENSTDDAGRNTNISVSHEEVQDALYKVGDKVDAKDLDMGAWFEAVVVMVTTEYSNDERVTILYHVKFEDYNEEEIAKLTSANVRPRACYRLQWEQLSEGSLVMVNYNCDSPTKRGFWYDAHITRIDKEKMEMYGKLMLGASTEEASQEVQIRFVAEIYRIETRQSGREENGGGEEGVVQRMKKPDCDHCHDNPRRKCRHCACRICGGKDSPDKQILCDECDSAYHLWCLTPELDSVPQEEDWYCPDCKTDRSAVIGAGEGMRISKKKANMVSMKSSSGRDWGKGMATVGRTKACTIVPPNHFGPIPGVPVGSCWKFRVQVGESGVHRHQVGGIHGRAGEGAYSIVVSGGYQDDVDKGEEFIYSGCGGRDLSGNKRTTKKQSSDQKLTALNLALARNCDAPPDSDKGATGKNWRKGKPVRVVRNYKARKMSEYAPEEGNRYDGIYKVVKYWPHSGQEGLVVWKYLMRRDDPSPAPWTKEGRDIIQKLGLTMQYPEGSIHDQKGKRKRSESFSESSPSLPSKLPRYDLTQHQNELLHSDTLNRKLWEELLDEDSSAGMLERIQVTFTCLICQELVWQAITTPCLHNICKSCLCRSFKAGVHTCPACRHELGRDFDMNINESLQATLLDIFPGYGSGR